MPLEYKTPGLVIQSFDVTPCPLPLKLAPSRTELYVMLATVRLVTPPGNPSKYSPVQAKVVDGETKAKKWLEKNTS